MALRPSRVTAVLAGGLAGVAMPLLWKRVGDDTTLLVVAFLGVVVLPAHALVVGFGRAPGTDDGLAMRVVAWLVTACAAAALSGALA